MLFKDQVLEVMGVASMVLYWAERNNLDIRALFCVAEALLARNGEFFPRFKEFLLYEAPPYTEMELRHVMQFAQHQGDIDVLLGTYKRKSLFHVAYVVVTMLRYFDYVKKKNLLLSLYVPFLPSGKDGLINTKVFDMYCTIHKHAQIAHNEKNLISSYFYDVKTAKLILKSWQSAKEKTAITL